VPQISRQLPPSSCFIVHYLLMVYNLSYWNCC
jgi:hypothetical protein